MTHKLYWDGGLGGARKDNSAAVIRNKPALSFAYDVLLFDDTRASYQLGGDVRQLNSDQIKECSEYIDRLLLSARIGGTEYESALSQAAEAVRLSTETAARVAGLTPGAGEYPLIVKDKDTEVTSVDKLQFTGQVAVEQGAAGEAEVHITAQKLEVKQADGQVAIKDVHILKTRGMELRAGDNPGEAVITPRVRGIRINDRTKVLDGIRAITVLGATVTDRGGGNAVITVDKQIGVQRNTGFLAYVDRSLRMMIANNAQSGNVLFPMFDNVVVASPNVIRNDSQGGYAVQPGWAVVSINMAISSRAIEDGYIRVTLVDATTGEPVLDANKQPLGVQRNYKAGQAFGSLLAAGAVYFPATTTVRVKVFCSFADALEIQDRSEGASGLLIQPITDDMQTSEALLQYEHDVKHSLRFTTVNLADIGSLSPTLVDDLPLVSYTPQTDARYSTGWFFLNFTMMKYGIANRTLTLQDDAVNPASFALGRTFDAEITRLVRGKAVKVVWDIVTKNDFIVWLATYSGTPDEYDWRLVTGLQDDGTPILAKGWKLSPVSLDMAPQPSLGYVAGTLPVDATATNFAVFMTPEKAEYPLQIQMTEFAFSAEPAGTAVTFAASLPITDMPLHLQDSYVEFQQTNQYWEALRYTINKAATPMPVGKPVKGQAQITVDPSYNKIAGSGASGGEGALVFGADGTVSVSTLLRVYNEQNTPSAVTFYYAKVAGDGSTVRLPTTGAFTIPANSVASVNVMPTFVLDVLAGDKIVLFAQADKDDGAFLQAVPGKPMLETTIVYTRYTTN